MFESCTIVDWKWGGEVGGDGGVLVTFFGIGGKNDCGGVKTFWEMTNIFRGSQNLFGI